MTELRYKGSCHCGFVQFEAECDIDHLRVCDCSVCHKRGALIFRIPQDKLILYTPLSEMSCYQWGSHTGADYFCPYCGILPFRKPSAPTREEREKGVQPFDGWAINLRCLDDFDTSDLPRKIIQGSLI